MVMALLILDKTEQTETELNGNTKVGGQWRRARPGLDQ